MLMLIDNADPRYGGAPDPDEERRRRWEPISMRIFLPAAGSLSCLAASAATGPVGTYVLNVAAIGLCLHMVRAAWPRGDARATGEEPGASGTADDGRP